MSKKQNQKDKEFLRSVKEQLYMETFETDVPDYSHEKVETLVKMLELEEGSDEQELAEAQKAFEERFRKKTEVKKRDKGHIYRKKALQTVAAMLAVVMLADITSEAVMDESVFHVFSWWKNQMSIVPGESTQVELKDFQEDETQIFTQIEEFAKVFGDDFLVCTWLPDGVELKEILSTQVGSSYSYMWEYGNKQKNNIINIRMYKKKGKDIAGLTGTQIENGEKLEFTNGLCAEICIANDGEYVAAFEYNEWWYLIHTSTDKEVIKSLIGGMKKYEKEFN